MSRAVTRACPGILRLKGDGAIKVRPREASLLQECVLGRLVCSFIRGSGALRDV